MKTHMCEVAACDSYGAAGDTCWAGHGPLVPIPERNKIGVLHDGGFVRLVDKMGGDLSVVRAARVSYDADWRAGLEEGSDTKLIRYLVRNRHTSPLESVQLTFEIKCPIFIARQWHRHRTWAYNEISGRYAELDEGFYVPLPEHVGVQSKDNKQVRDAAPATDAANLAVEQMRVANQNSVSVYRQLLQSGVPRELARSVLPVAAYTRFFGTVSLHNLFGFIKLRLHPHAQLEMQQYAQALLALAGTVAPITVQAWKDYSND